MTQGNPVSTANRIHPNQSIFDRIRIATNCYAVKDQKGTHTHEIGLKSHVERASFYWRVSSDQCIWLFRILKRNYDAEATQQSNQIKFFLSLGIYDLIKRVTKICALCWL